MDLVTVTELACLIIGGGGAGAVIYNQLRQLGRSLDKLAGNGDEEPGVVARLERLQKEASARDNRIVELATAIRGHVDGDAKTWLAEGQEWGHRLDEEVASLDRRVSVLEDRASGVDPVVALK